MADTYRHTGHPTLTAAAPAHLRASHSRARGRAALCWFHLGEPAGPSDMENLVLLCAFHHRLIHREGFLISRSDGGVRVHRPDGTPVTDAREVRCRPRRARPPPRGRDPDVDPDPVWLTDHRLARGRIDRLANVACNRRNIDATVQGR